MQVQLSSVIRHHCKYVWTHIHLLAVWRISLARRSHVCTNTFKSAVQCQLYVSSIWGWFLRVCCVNPGLLSCFSQIGEAPGIVHRIFFFFPFKADLTITISGHGYKVSGVFSAGNCSSATRPPPRSGQTAAIKCTSQREHFWAMAVNSCHVCLRIDSIFRAFLCCVSFPCICGLVSWSPPAVQRKFVMLWWCW